MIGVGRGIALNFQDLATQLLAAQSVGLSVRSLSESTRRSDNIIMGLRSWANALGLVNEFSLTPLANTLLRLDPTFTQPLIRGICYIEMLTISYAEVPHHLGRKLLPRWSTYGSDHQGWLEESSVFQQCQQ